MAWETKCQVKFLSKAKTLGPYQVCTFLNIFYH
jgi:hypothetical protein